MKKRLAQILFIFFSFLCFSSCGEDVTIFTIVQFLEPNAAGCMALRPNGAYLVQVTFAEFSGKPVFEPPGSFSISAINEDDGQSVGWFEGYKHSMIANPYTIDPPASSFTLWYRTPLSINEITDIRFETTPSVLKPELQPDCQIIP